jgi:hypothetical protein
MFSALCSLMTALSGSLEETNFGVIITISFSSIASCMDNWKFIGLHRISPSSTASIFLTPMFHSLILPPSLLCFLANNFMLGSVKIRQLDASSTSRLLQLVFFFWRVLGYPGLTTETFSGPTEHSQLGIYNPLSHSKYLLLILLQSCHTLRHTQLSMPPSTCPPSVRPVFSQAFILASCSSHSVSCFFFCSFDLSELSNTQVQHIGALVGTFF